MALRSSVPIPVASTEYDAMNEAITRRTIEQALQDIHTDIGELRRMQ